MTREVGEPQQVGDVGSGFYTVGISDRNNLGTLSATGSVAVTLPAGDYPDEESMREAAKALALQMVDADPSLLTPVRLSGGTTHKSTVEYDATGKTPFSDGRSKHGDGAAGQARRILSPDDPGAAL